MAAGELASRPSLYDVARAAGVSHQTVSRVLNGHANVRESTRDRVRRAVDELGYRTNAAARTLRTRSARTIGIVAVNTTFYGPASLLAAIEQAARADLWSVSTVSLPRLDQATVRAAFDQLADQQVAGVIVIAPQRAVADALVSRPDQVPVVSVDGHPGHGLPTVRVDQAEGARLVTEHLLDLGHATVHHVAGPEVWLDAQDRVVGWRRSLASRGAPVPDVLRGDWTPRSGHEAGRLLARDPTVTAIFAANDQMALGVLRALQESGRDVPGDVSVAGFDDVPESEYFGPSLTTIRQQFTEVGRLSIRRLLSLVHGREPTGDDVVAPELVVRCSTAAPPSPHRSG